MRSLLPIASFILILSSLATFAQQQPSTPEQAASALTEALSQQDEATLSKVLGDSWRQSLPIDGIDLSVVNHFQRGWRVGHVIVQQGDNARLGVDSETQRLPVLIVKTLQDWCLDMAAGEEEILTCVIGRSELSAIAAVRVYIDVQQDRYQFNHHWVQKIISSESKKDGLYWPVSLGETSSPLGSAFSPTGPGAGYHGCRLRTIVGCDDQDMALLARPTEWGETGVMSFMIDLYDTVYQVNLGEGSAVKVQAITCFVLDTDVGWQAVRP